MRTRRGISGSLLLCGGIALAALPDLARADSGAAPPDSQLASGLAPFAAGRMLPSVDSAPPDYLPAPASDRALELEAALREAHGDDLGAAAALRERLAREPGSAALHWQLARSLVRAGEALPEGGEHADERRRYFLEAVELAARGRALDGGCAECCLYQFAANAELVALAGMRAGIHHLREAGRLVEECLAAPPSEETSSEAADLYYGAAAYFRRVPGGLLAHLALGVRGDTARAVALARHAAELDPDRLSFRAELAAALLCHGTREDDPHALRAGRAELDALAALPAGPPEEERYRAPALALEAAPERACDFGPGSGAH